jgi:hypothetical protein
MMQNPAEFGILLPGIKKDTTLEVRGFRHLEFIGMNMNFKKIG